LEHVFDLICPRIPVTGNCVINVDANRDAHSRAQDRLASGSRNRAAFGAVVSRLALSVKGTVESAYAEGWIGEETLLEAVKHWDRAKTITGTIPQGMDDLREQIQALAARGLDKGEIKRAINFNRLRKTWPQEEMNAVNAAINAAVKQRKRSTQLCERAARFKAEGFTKGKNRTRLGWSMATEGVKQEIDQILDALYCPPG
jgi:hypothetical protein